VSKPSACQHLKLSTWLNACQVGTKLFYNLYRTRSNFLFILDKLLTITKKAVDAQRNLYYFKTIIERVLILLDSPPATPVSNLAQPARLAARSISKK
jgi:hypothetical protein